MCHWEPPGHSPKPDCVSHASPARDVAGLWHSYVYENAHPYEDEFTEAPVFPRSRPRELRSHLLFDCLYIVFTRLARSEQGSCVPTSLAPIPFS